VLVLGRGVGLGGLRRIPYGTLLLLGGSFAMAAGIEGSGLSGWLAQMLEPVARLPLAGQVALATAATVVLSAVASNTATINLMLNLLPRSLVVLSGSAIAASCDFALPAGTPPNAIVFGSGYVRLPVMMRTGLLLDVLASVVITIYSLLYLRLILT
jgi:sodium-dependent dicarboxylate transporter 2/3/5